jgi:Uma2 family endonuclease
MNILREPWSVAQFLEWEDRQEGKHEFNGSRIIEMTGGTRAYQRIVTNLIRFFEDHLDPARFDAAPEMRIELGGKVRYPDVAVVAGRVPNAVKTLRDALVLFEVLSEETSETDLVHKRAEYAGLPSIRRYVILEQERVAATVLERVPRGWWESELSSGSLDVPEFGFSLPLAAIYRGSGL